MRRVKLRVRETTEDFLAAQIAERSAAELAGQLSADITTMSTAELRGYLRARAICCVRARVAHAIATHQFAATQTDALVAAALERTASLLARDLKLPPVIALPAPHVSMRAAA
jgi:hypothetical protein